MSRISSLDGGSRITIWNRCCSDIVPRGTYVLQFVSEREVPPDADHATPVPPVKVNLLCLVAGWTFVHARC